VLGLPTCAFSAGVLRKRQARTIIASSDCRVALAGSSQRRTNLSSRAKRGDLPFAFTSWRPSGQFECSVCPHALSALGRFARDRHQHDSWRPYGQNPCAVRTPARSLLETAASPWRAHRRDGSISAILTDY